MEKSSDDAGSGKSYKASYMVYIAVACAQMSAIGMGSTYGWSAPAFEDIGHGHWPFTPTTSQQSLIASILTIGALFGGMLVGFCMDRFGRKRTLIGLGVPYTAGWLLIGFAQSLAPVLIGRALTGLAMGITTAVLPAYIAEISTPDIRGFIGMTFNFCVVFGTFYMDIIYIFDYRWNQLAFWAVLPAILLSLSMLLMPESPLWCVNCIQDRQVARESALNSLQRLRSEHSDIRGELADLIISVERLQHSQNKGLRFSLSTIKRADVYKPFLIGMLLLFFQQFCGVNAVMFYSNSIFKDSGSNLEPKFSTLISNGFMLLFTVIGSLIIDRFGRRILLIASAIGLMLSIGTLGIYYYQHDPVSPKSFFDSTTTTTIPTAESSTGSLLPLICVTIFLSSFSLGIGPITWIIITEITPPQTKGLISSTSSMFAWIFTFLIVNEAEDLKHLLNTYGMYWMFACITFCCSVFAYLLPETKGKTAEDMVKIFKYETSKPAGII